MKQLGSLLVFPLMFAVTLNAQDTLPKFTVRNTGGGKIIISWTNQYTLVKQISIQRSADSARNYKTILSVPDPMNRQNGYVDTKAPSTNMFYRLFIVLDGSSFLFSTPKRPVIDSTTAVVEQQQKKTMDPFSVDVNRPARGIDSSLKSNNLDAKNKPNIWVPSIYVYTARDGNIHLNLPEADTRKFSIKFFDENNELLFELKELKEPSLIIDKSNFFHAGWFHFELYADEKLQEKNKFFIEKEF